MPYILLSLIRVYRQTDFWAIRDAGIIKRQANHIIDHEKNGSASGTGSS